MILPGADRLQGVGEYYFSQKLEQIRLLNIAGRKVINLGIGSPDMLPSPQTLSAAITAIQSDESHGYASYRSTPGLREAIAKWYQSTYDVAVDFEREVLPLLGSKEGILYVSMAFLNPGDKVLIPNPGYPAYASISHLIGAKAIPYNLCENRNWWPDFEALEKSDLSGVKMMWVNYPHMPTGASAAPELFEKLIAFGMRHKILIAHDNPYSLVLNPDPPLSLLSFDPKREISLELNSFSKSFNMAGWRVGMLIAHAEVVNRCLQVKSNVDSGMFLPVQSAAVQALANPQSWHEARNFVYQQRRRLVYRIFDLLKFTYSREQVGLFVWAKAPDEIKDVQAFVDQLLLKAGVFLTPGFIFGTLGARYARCSLCASEEQLKESIQRLENYLEASLS